MPGSPRPRAGSPQDACCSPTGKGLLEYPTGLWQQPPSAPASSCSSRGWCFYPHSHHHGGNRCSGDPSDLIICPHQSPWAPCCLSTTGVLLPKGLCFPFCRSSSNPLSWSTLVTYFIAALPSTAYTPHPALIFSCSPISCTPIVLMFFLSPREVVAVGWP